MKPNPINNNQWSQIRASHEDRHRVDPDPPEYEDCLTILDFRFGRTKEKPRLQGGMSTAKAKTFHPFAHHIPHIVCLDEKKPVLRPSSSEQMHFGKPTAPLVQPMGSSPVHPYHPEEPEVLVAGAMLFQFCQDSWERMDEDEEKEHLGRKGLETPLSIPQPRPVMPTQHFAYSHSPLTISHPTTSSRAHVTTTGFTPINNNSQAPQMYVSHHGIPTFTFPEPQDHHFIGNTPAPRPSTSRMPPSPHLPENEPRRPKQRKTISYLTDNESALREPKGGALMSSVRQNNAIRKRLVDEHEALHNTSNTLVPRFPTESTFSVNPQHSMLAPEFSTQPNHAFARFSPHEQIKQQNLRDDFHNPGGGGTNHGFRAAQTKFLTTNDNWSYAST